jgi:hypothetical protein
MTSTLSRSQQAEHLLQEGVACAEAVLYAISGGNMLGALPADPHERTAHCYATQLLAMLEDNLRAIQMKVDALPATPRNGEA